MARWSYGPTNNCSEPPRAAQTPEGNPRNLRRSDHSSFPSGDASSADGIPQWVLIMLATPIMGKENDMNEDTTPDFEQSQLMGQASALRLEGFIRLNAPNIFIMRELSILTNHVANMMEAHAHQEMRKRGMPS